MAWRACDWLSRATGRVVAVGLLGLVGLLWGLAPAWAHSYGVHPAEMIYAHLAGEGGVSAEVVYEKGVFTPNYVELELGDRVVFVNRSDDFVWPASNIHPTHEVYPGFDPELGLEPGEAWAFGFTRPGIWKFHNHLAPNQGGTVTVLGIEEQAPLRDEIDPETLAFEPLEEPLDVTMVQRLHAEDDTLLQAIKTYGPAPVVSELARDAFENNTNCHERAHVLGRMAYDLYGVAAFSLSGHECQSGSYHGTIEALFRDRGTSDLANDVATICAAADKSFFRHQCIHGIGHGLMAWSNYELNEALELCSQLEESEESRHPALSCYSGVFMENVVGGLSGDMGHITNYLSDEDPHFPCNIVAERFIPSCYYYQTSHMIKLFRGDFRELAIACVESPEDVRYLCFNSMGRDVGAATAGDPELAVEYCSYVLNEIFRANCISGAAQDWFWEASGATPALRICQLASDASAKKLCYEILIRRAYDVLDGHSQRAAFCQGVEPGYEQEVSFGHVWDSLLSGLNPWAEEFRYAGFEDCHRLFPAFDEMIDDFFS